MTPDENHTLSQAQRQERFLVTDSGLLETEVLAGDWFLTKASLFVGFCPAVVNL